jgi:hypothetical protein
MGSEQLRRLAQSMSLGALVARSFDLFVYCPPRFPTNSVEVNIWVGDLGARLELFPASG